MTRLVLLHGFTQNATSWAPIVERFSPDFDIEAIDLPGHGSAADEPLDLAAGADRIAEQGGRAVYVGYSMGGRFLVNLALRHPELTESLVLLGVTAGIEDPHERATRIEADTRLADEIERDGLDVFLDRWLERPMFAHVPDDRARRLHNTPAGLAGALRLAGTGTQDPPLWDRLGEISAPTLVLAGAHDTKFTELGRKLRGAIGANASFESIPDAGHAAHLEQPDVFVEIVERWLSERPDPPRTATRPGAAPSR